jgi:hypothetical protein
MSTQAVQLRQTLSEIRSLLREATSAEDRRSLP